MRGVVHSSALALRTPDDEYVANVSLGLRQGQRLWGGREGGREGGEGRGGEGRGGEGRGGEGRGGEGRGGEGRGGEGEEEGGRDVLCGRFFNEQCIISVCTLDEFQWS